MHSFLRLLTMVTGIGCLVFAGYTAVFLKLATEATMAHDSWPWFLGIGVVLMLLALISGGGSSDEDEEEEEEG